MSVLEYKQAVTYIYTYTHTYVYFLLDILYSQIYLTLTVFPKYRAADLFQVMGK